MKQVVPWVVVVGLVAVGFFWLSRQHDAALEVWRLRAEAAIARADRQAQVTDSLRVVELELRARGTRVRLRVDTVVVRAESLVVAGDTGAALAPFRAALGLCRVALVLADSALTTCEQRAAIERDRADSLGAVLAQGIKLHRRRWGCTAGVGGTVGLRRWGAVGASVTCGRHF